ncbi:hypothetical protein FITA111629_05995 [Filibacter tadaridae]|uniref:ABC-2 family transporter protein n=2 Tax=Filibacter tadaridae TaxID=2483811 RepID=A0A3P5WTK1_9BACL|nr:hypothetical protein [Filibacter tadaridae]VDC19326.1 hypothetical protein FILTAD_00262 [Filibacter tadaridae]
MYLTVPRLTDIVKKQFRYKMNAYTGIFSSLLIMQLIGIFFGVNSYSSYEASESLRITDATSTGDTPVVLTLVWAFITGILVTTLAYRNDAFSFVSNRLSHHLSSFLLVLLASVVGGITAVLAGSIGKFIVYAQNSTITIESPGLLDSPFSFFIGIATSILYTILFAGLGYTIGSFVQRSKLVIPLIVIVLIALPALNLSVGGVFFIEKTIAFFGTETSFLIFLMKVVITVVVLFALSVAVTNKTEVRK